LEVGPNKFVQRDHEFIATEIRSFINLKPRHYCIIKNPVIKHDQGIVMTEFPNGAAFAAVMFGNIEIRKQEDYSEPFPLYPFEEMEQSPIEYKKVNQSCALLLRAVRPFTDEKTKIERFINDEYLFVGGVGFYIPRVEEEIVKEIKFPVIKPQTALVVKAKKDLKDSEGIDRIAGQRWLIRKQGIYQPHVDEDVLEVRKAHILTDKKCIHLRALKNMKDVYGVKRRAGDEWLVGI
jgi:major vault protein